MKAASRSLLLALFILLLSASGAIAQVGYTFDVTTTYQFGGSGQPDTGLLTITNNGASTFSGTLDLSGTANAGASFDDSFTGTLAPGASLSFASGPEGSNQGGFNGTLGALFTITGTVTNGGSESVSLSVNDSDIHSGVARTGCSGSTDAYVLQGGSTGCDNGDGFETTQAAGHFEFFEAPSSTPEPASLLLMGTGLLGLCRIGRKKLQA